MREEKMKDKKGEERMCVRGEDGEITQKSVEDAKQGDIQQENCMHKPFSCSIICVL